MLNKVTLIGNLGSDTELRFDKNGTAIASISLATTRRWKDKESGERKEETEWHRVVFFNRLAEIAGEYLKKGSQVYIEGRIKTRSWDDNGQKRYTTEILGEEMQMLGGKQKEGETQRQYGEQRPSKYESPKPDDGDFDDDIPF